MATFSKILIFTLFIFAYSCVFALDADWQKKYSKEVSQNEYILENKNNPNSFIEIKLEKRNEINLNNELDQIVSFLKCSKHEIVNSINTKIVSNCEIENDNIIIILLSSHNEYLLKVIGYDTTIDVIEKVMDSL